MFFHRVYGRLNEPFPFLGIGASFGQSVAHFSELRKLMEVFLRDKTADTWVCTVVSDGRNEHSNNSLGTELIDMK